MDGLVIVINSGSSSQKGALFRIGAVPELELRASVTGIGTRPELVVRGEGGPRPADVTDHESALELLLETLERRLAGRRLVGAGHRVVHGGQTFAGPVRVDDGVLGELEALIPLAPLHQRHNLEALRTLARLRPEVPQVACFDTAFHRSLPAVRRTFALPRELTDSGVRPYGFHGLSFESIAAQLPRHLGSGADGRVVVAHLGHGASLCAMRQRRSVATTMTFTPLDGLPMSTRSGALDPAVVLYLLRERRMSVSAVSELLHDRSGLAGLSGVAGGDMRAVLASPSGAEAVECFIDRVGLAIGSMAAALSGIDALVFTGGIGEGSTLLRRRIMAHAAWLGIELDAEANERGGPEISSSLGKVSAWVLPTREEDVIARHTVRLLRVRDTEERHAVRH
jgi:acetate kinase